MKRPIRILFNIFVDERNVNAQSLNARDIALRLDKERFECSMFVLNQPDCRLVNRKNIHLIRLPARMGSLVIASHLIWGRYDLVFYPPFNHLMEWSDSLKWTRREKKVIATAEGTAEALQTLPSPVRERLLRMLREADACYAISPYIAESMSRQFDLRMGVVPIGVDTGMFTPCDRAKRVGPTKVLCVSSIQPRKQVDLLLDIARQVGPQKLSSMSSVTSLGLLHTGTVCSSARWTKTWTMCTFVGKCFSAKCVNGCSNVTFLCCRRDLKELPRFCLRLLRAVSRALCSMTTILHRW